ncbi:thioredoxin family protein [Thalassovita sp.]|mgnify:CR=1 FL=1|uniref:thioredoxin family protein n=1 Tax=Thalassovita sp. TaxID=1979401 RepID=UPI002B26BE82|nr:thioredoxin family protein [Thalassovita sp.]
MHRLFRIFAPLLLIILPAFAQAVELVMVERQGCHYCIEWKTDLGPIYPNTAAGKYAPLRVIDIADDVPADLSFVRKVVFTPTFVLVEEGREIGRIEGYPGEDFFWGLLEMMLKSKTDFNGGV